MSRKIYIDNVIVKYISIYISTVKISALNGFILNEQQQHIDSC